MKMDVPYPCILIKQKREYKIYHVSNIHVQINKSIQYKNNGAMNIDKHCCSYMLMIN